MDMCLTPGCGNPKPYQRRYCEPCRRKRYAEKLRSEGRFCSVDGCDKIATCKNLCHMHYRRWKYHGDVNALKRRSNGEGCIIPNGYMSHYVGRRHKLEHRLVVEQQLGRPLTKEEIVHHRNRDKLDNRPENLVVLDRATHKLVCDMENVLSLSPERFYELFDLISEQFDFDVAFVPRRRA